MAPQRHSRIDSGYWPLAQNSPQVSKNAVFRKHGGESLSIFGPGSFSDRPLLTDQS
jgi:hypothetical protein